MKVAAEHDQGVAHEVVKNTEICPRGDDGARVDAASDSHDHAHYDSAAEGPVPTSGVDDNLPDVPDSDLEDIDLPDVAEKLSTQRRVRTKEKTMKDKIMIMMMNESRHG